MKTFKVFIFTIGLLITGQVKALDNWDIDTNTTISNGVYDMVRVDFNNPGGSSNVDMYGGTIASLGTYQASTFELSLSGIVGNLNAFNDSTFIFLGGSLRNIWGFDDSHIIIHGSGFNYNLGDIDATSGRIIGYSPTGQELLVNFERHDNATITLVPEPSITICLIGGLLITRRKWMVGRV